MDVGYGAGMGTPIYRKPPKPKKIKEKKAKGSKDTLNEKVKIRIKDRERDRDRDRDPASDKKIRIFFRSKSTRHSHDTDSLRGSFKSSVGSTQSSDAPSSRPLTAEIVVEEVAGTPVDEENELSRSIQSLPLPQDKEIHLLRRLKSEPVHIPPLVEEIHLQGLPDRYDHVIQPGQRLGHALERPVHPLERLPQYQAEPPAYTLERKLLPLDSIGRPAPDLKIPVLPERRRPPLDHSPASDVSSTMNAFASVDNSTSPPPPPPPPPAAPAQQQLPHQHKKTMDVSDAIGSYTSITPNVSATTVQNPQAIYAHIHETSNKRMSTLDYLRKTHEGRVYWYNTLLYSRADITRLPSFEPKRLARKATNLLLLGLSLPMVLDLNTSNATDYLRALNALLTEFDAYQSIHPADGSTGSSSGATSLSRAARLPQMFKRSAMGKARRSSSSVAASANDIGLPLSATANDPSSFSSDPSGISSSNSNSHSNSNSNSNSSNTVTSIPPSLTSSLSSIGGPFGTSDQDLLPGEEYSHLQTPSIPFDPDFFETFATLCDILIDCYWKLLDLVSSPAQCGSGVGDAFAKVDAKLRKVIVQGIVKEFEEATRAGVKVEVSGIAKVVMGGLM